MKGRYFKYCPYSCYHDVEIDISRLSTIPVNDTVVDLPTIDDNKCNDGEDLPDNGPAKDQYDVFDINEEIASYSGIVCPFDIVDADDQLKMKLKEIIGDDVTPTQYVKSGKLAEVPFNKSTQEKPLSEMQVEGFWTMCYPYIFINGSCDLTIKGFCTVPYDEWVEHIYYNVDNGVPSDSSFDILTASKNKQIIENESFCIRNEFK